MFFLFNADIWSTAYLDVPQTDCGQMDTIDRYDSEENVQNCYCFYFQ